MDLITIDFETYYSPAFSLSKLTTEEYIRHESFEVIGVSVKVNAEEPVWFSGTMLATNKFLHTFNWGDALSIAHNAMFDMAILSWHFAIHPKRIADTLCMGRALHGTEVGGSLATLAKFYDVGEKGTEVLNALSKRRIDFTPKDLLQYGEYCKNDVELTYRLFDRMVRKFPIVELRLIDLTTRMFTEPVLRIDQGVLRTHLTKVQQAKETLMSRLAADKGDIMSNDKFAVLLQSYGVQPPRKISATTGRETWAFAKTDEAFKELLEHVNEMVQALVAARLGVKSTLEETRTQRMLDIAARGTLPVPLRYYAAHTGRWGGSDKTNLQNLPRGSMLKKAILPPPGHVFIDCDSSQIEARTVAWLAEQYDLVEAFDRGEDVYKIMASAIYGKPVAEISKDERFVGKTTILGCIGAGTQVLCDSGWKPIEQVSLSDKLWDGEEWVCHQGLVNKGFKETWRLCGIWLTPDHKILCGTEWKEAQSVVQDASIRSQALATGAENLPFPGMYAGCVVGSRPLLSDALAAGPSTRWTTTTSRTLGVPAALHALKKLQMKLVSYIGDTRKPCQMTSIGSGYSIGYRPQLAGATTPAAEHTKITGEEVLPSSKSGGRTVGPFLDMYKRWTDGMTQSGRLTGSTTPKDTRRATYASPLGVKTCVINDDSQIWKTQSQTYDIAYAGPRNRYTILTARGAMIAHNCGYGMGAAKFQAQLKNFNVDLPQEECERIIQVYRETYPRIPMLWKEANSALNAIHRNSTAPLGRDGALVVAGDRGIRLPNGLYLRYPNLRRMELEDGNKTQFVYDARKGKATIPNKIYGGKVVENCCQALARIVIGEQLLLIAKKYKVVMTVHDAIGCVVPEQEAEVAKEFIEAKMRVRPEWAPDLPLNCESGIGMSYGDC